MKITVKHKKGKHNACLWSMAKIMFASLFLNKRRYFIEFSEKSKYHIDGRNQTDWSKVIGRGSIAYGKDGGQGYPTRKFEQYITWRYDDKKDEFQVTNTYARINHKMQTPTTWDSCKAGQMIATNMRVFYSVLPLGGYFGGNDPAPNDLEYKIIIK